MFTRATRSTPDVMGGRLTHPRTCTVLYSWDVGVLLDLSEWIPAYVLLFLLTIGAYTVFQHALRSIRVQVPRTYRRASSTFFQWSRSLSSAYYPRWLSIRRPRSVRRRDPLVNLSPRAPRSPTPRSPRREPLPQPSTVSILAPMRDPPPELVHALQDYQRKPHGHPR